MSQLLKLVEFLDRDDVTEVVVATGRPVTLRMGGEYRPLGKNPASSAQVDALFAGSAVAQMVATGGGASLRMRLAERDCAVDVQVHGDQILVRLTCRNDCVLVASPAAINVPTGTEFEVNWINTGDTECDVAKIDQFNQVPIILGLEPGTSYHDAVRRWCGPFTGNFQFRISICTLPSFIPVDCSSP